ncbi:MAG: serine hydrolase [Gammaproteobacteria bacterium]|nr:serine hydrolase [Gammaproteobacteria bacterium]
MRVINVLAVFIPVFLSSCSHTESQERLNFVTSLFTGVEQFENFDRVVDFFPTKELSASPDPLVFKQGKKIDLPLWFEFQGNRIDVKQYLLRTDTSALLILRDGKIVYENYWLTGGKEKNWLSMSVAKSFISALIGIAVDEGFVESIQDAVTDYVPQLRGSSYDGVRIKDILNMSSGASWNENYSDSESDIMRSARILASGGSLDDFSASLEKDFVPGTFNRYNSTDTQVLGMLLRETTGTSVTAYMKKKFWDPIGAQDSGYWILDSEEMEMVYAGFNATARDYAKLGELYRLEGKLNGRQIISGSWVRASLTPDQPHLMPGDNPLSDFPMGYGYQWWIPDASGDFTAIGVYNQFIYVSPKSGMVAVKLSANSVYGLDDEVSTLSELEGVGFFKALAFELRTKRQGR